MFQRAAPAFLFTAAPVETKTQRPYITGISQPRLTIWRDQTLSCRRISAAHNRQ
jgi:hypothetical protein